ncbi:MAG: hypothetical protein BWK80_51990 [Desulfobacteraceae bacterium IS3]|nr:MAG: hypothetical protein BWK80_51990 [Desulfobacteraceae bacterium IS3]
MFSNKKRNRGQGRRNRTLFMPGCSGSGFRCQSFVRICCCKSGSRVGNTRGFFRQFIIFSAVFSEF